MRQQLGHRWCTWARLLSTALWGTVPDVAPDAGYGTCLRHWVATGSLCDQQPPDRSSTATCYLAVLAETSRVLERGARVVTLPVLEGVDVCPGDWLIVSPSVAGFRSVRRQEVDRDRVSITYGDLMVEADFGRPLLTRRRRGRHPRRIGCSPPAPGAEAAMSAWGEPGHQKHASASLYNCCPCRAPRATYRYRRHTLGHRPHHRPRHRP